MADKKIKQKEPKKILEREYIVPLRDKWLRVGKHKRASRAVRELKIFLAKHMKIYDRDLRKIKINNDLNNELRFRGMRKPPAQIKVKAIKYDNDIVVAELVEVPEHIKFARIREEKKNKDIKKKVEEISKESPEKKEETKEESKIEAKEKQEASKEEGLAIAKEEAKEQKHISKIEKPSTQNIGYKRAQKGR